MLIDAETIESGTTLTADVCIVGGGAAGVTIAMELLDSGLDVLLLESGGDEPDPETQALYEGASVGQPLGPQDGGFPIDQVRLRYLGGTTNHWAGFCRPLEPIDFELRDGFDVSGWPIARDELLPFWERATEWCRVVPDFSPRIWEERMGWPAAPVDNDVVGPVVFHVAYPLSFGTTYRADLDASASTRVLLHANAVNLATDDGRLVSGVDVRTFGGVRLRAEADAYVVATGGIENARLLLASTDADPGGLGNGNDLVGRYFTEHFQVASGFGVLRPPIEDVMGFRGGEIPLTAGRHAGAKHGVKFALALTSDHVRDRATTGMEMQLALGTLPDGGPTHAGGVTTSDVAGLLSRTGPAPGTVAFLQILAEQRLRPESRITLDDAVDTLGMPRTRLDWQYTAEDRAEILVNLRTFAEQIGAEGLGRAQIVPGGARPDAEEMIPGEIVSLYRSIPGEIDEENFPIGIGFHHMCTTRMAADPAEGVVDADCRMHEIENLWIGGSSVFATGGVSTPTFTIVALAVRLADHLKRQLGS